MKTCASFIQKKETDDFKCSSCGGIVGKYDGLDFGVCIDCGQTVLVPPTISRKVPVEQYSRVVGYYRPVDQWNRGKQEEFNERKAVRV